MGKKQNDEKPLAIAIDYDGEVYKIYKMPVHHFHRTLCMVVLLENIPPNGIRETLECLSGMSRNQFFVGENVAWSSFFCKKNAK